jgi:hypothetical protein
MYLALGENNIRLVLLDRGDRLDSLVVVDLKVPV